MKVKALYDKKENLQVIHFKDTVTEQMSFIYIEARRESPGGKKRDENLPIFVSF